MVKVTLDANGKVPKSMIVATRPPKLVLAEQNGAVRDSLLIPVDDLRGKVFMMAELPARGMKAMHAAIKREMNIILRSTGRGRTLRQQWDGFGGGQNRYRACSLEDYERDFKLQDERTKFWPRSERLAVGRLLNLPTPIPDSDYWTKVRLASGFFPATSAVPGTSPHGMWCADDLALPDSDDPGPEFDSVTLAVVEWLFANERDFGFAHGIKSEKWHVQWIAGNDLPPAVIEFEAGRGGGRRGRRDPDEDPDEDPDTDPQEDDDMAKAFKTPDEAAIFVASGLVLSWVNDLKDYNVAVFLGLAPPLDDVHIVDKSIFRSFRLAGAIPPDFDASDFQEVIAGESTRRSGPTR